MLKYVITKPYTTGSDERLGRKQIPNGRIQSTFKWEKLPRMELSL